MTEYPPIDGDWTWGELEDWATDQWTRALRAERGLEFTREWWASRFERITDEIKNTDVWPRVASIMANGTAEVTEPPTYSQLYNAQRLRAEAAEKRLVRAEEALRYIAGEDVAGYEAHLRPEDVARSALSDPSIQEEG